MAASEAMGEIAVDAFVKKHMPGARKITFDFGNGTKQGMFDAVYEYQGRYYIFEAKGGGGGLGARTTTSGRYVQQGTDAYRDDVILDMFEKGELKVAAGGKDTELSHAISLQEAALLKKIDYLLVRQSIDGPGNIRLYLTIQKFQ